MRPLLAVMLFAEIVIAAPVPKAAKKKDDKQHLSGAWTVTSENGRPGSDATTRRFVFDDDGNVQTQREGGGVSNFVFSLDASTSPKRMRWVNRDGPDPAWDCVYTLDGNKLFIGFVTAGQAIPDEVKRGRHCYLFELDRESSAK